MERLDSESLCQPLCTWDFLQPAAWGCPIVISLVFLMLGKRLLWKHGICGKAPLSGVHPLFPQEKSEPVLLVGHGQNSQQHGAAHSHQCPSQHQGLDGALGFITPCHFACACINEQLPSWKCLCLSCWDPKRSGTSRCKTR